MKKTYTITKKEKMVFEGTKFNDLKPKQGGARCRCKKSGATTRCTKRCNNGRCNPPIEGVAPCTSASQSFESSKKIAPSLYFAQHL